MHTLNTLPLEILYLITKYLEHKDLYSLLFVCKLLNAVAGPTCRTTLIYDGRQHPTRLPAIASRVLTDKEYSHSIRTLKISGWNTPTRLPAISRTWVGAKLPSEVEAAFGDGNEDPLVLLLMRHLPNVAHLDIGHPLSRHSHQFPTRESFSGDNFTRLIDSPIFPHLRSVKYTGLAAFNTAYFIIPFLRYHKLDNAQLDLVNELYLSEHAVSPKHIIIGNRLAGAFEEDDGRKSCSLQSAALGLLVSFSLRLEELEYYHNLHNVLECPTVSPGAIASSLRSDTLRKLVLANFNPVYFGWNFYSSSDEDVTFQHLSSLEELTVQLHFLGLAPLDLQSKLPSSLRRLTLLECSRVGSLKVSGEKTMHMLDDSYPQWQQDELIAAVKTLKPPLELLLGDADWGNGSIVPLLQLDIPVYHDRHFPSWIKGPIVPTHGRLAISLPK